MKKFLILFSLIAFTTALSGCNTVQGFGQDVQSGGKALSSSAKKVKQSL